MPPVATITSTPRVGHQRLDQRDRRLLDHLQAAVGRARLDRRAASSCTAATLVLRASGCGETTTALRVISASRTLKYTVAIGLVDGVSASTTPAGFGTATIFASASTCAST